VVDKLAGHEGFVKIKRGVSIMATMNISVPDAMKD